MIDTYKQELKYKNDELALQYLPAVKAMAFRLKERLPSSVDYMDLNAIGTEELLKVARRYDESQNDSFWGYAKKRVYGSMLDYLRSLDVVSRANRKLIKAVDRAIEEYMLTHEDEPSDSELSTILGESIEKINEAKIASSIYTVMPLSDEYYHDGGDSTALQVERDDLIELIMEVLEEFSQKDQMVVQLYYFEELNLKEISQILSITESRVSQIHKSVISKIKQRVGA